MRVPEVLSRLKQVLLEYFSSSDIFYSLACTILIYLNVYSIGTFLKIFIDFF